MSTEEDNDPERFRWLAEGNARQARKRVSAKVVICGKDGRVLLVNPTYKQYWDLPGGMAEANESPTTAAIREVSEELGITVQINGLLLVDWVDAHGPWDDLLVFIFDGGAVGEEDMRRISVMDKELSEFAFFSLELAEAQLRPDMWLKLQRAVEAKRVGVVSYEEFCQSRTE
ncbi:NUDIX domain-containing protein [Saccharothrix violaceirubra]|uniref:8-oxo-dGTP pyrophosphatase MutT (NUDIX family) n=1 Tax=Saccharothrix violaceirubra TaxID=413306 RepID=A0A7W7T246_9PSEU|nr:NUDIX hydrolase [Saccharothrix violaceirubra]MBB4965174.1 8-oxo-dGTP pyrophosphatase MutT (NUDIX family) [Saccharothrix violaceirubra]